jgi:hypothetical protein
MRILTAAILVFLGLIFAVPICAGLANAVFGNPIYFSVFLIPAIAVVAWVVGRLVRRRSPVLALGIRE